MEPKKQAYEWVVNMSNGDYYLLTEAQYEHYRKNWENNKLFFDTFEINPAFVTSSSKREASDELKRKYPCLTCGTNGHLQEKNTDGLWKVCPNCEGTGMEK